jgi:hypothetical protein
MSTDLPPAIDPDDPPEDWFFEWGDTQAWRGVTQMISDWWNRLR